jgi:hypothetical protein
MPYINKKQSDLSLMFTQKVFHSFKFCFALLFLVFFNTGYCQNGLTLLAKDRSTIMSANNRVRIKVNVLENGSIVKYKGHLVVLDSQQIMVDSTVIAISSIYKFGKIPLEKQLIGHSMGVIGAAITTAGSYFMYKLFTLDQNNVKNPFLIGVAYAIIGSTLLSVGPPILVIGEYLALGNMKKVRKKGRLLVVHY